MTSIAAPMCVTCKHLFEDGYLECAAFPDGIPEEIEHSKFDHRKPHPDDNGLRYELVEGKEPTGLAAWQPPPTP